MPQTIGKQGLGKRTGQVIGFRRNKIALEGRLFYTGTRGNHDADKKDSQAKYVLVPIGYKIPWKKVREIGQWNNLHDTWDISLGDGDEVILQTESGKRHYEVLQ